MNQEEETTFRPQITDYSRQLHRTEPIYDRLFRISKEPKPTPLEEEYHFVPVLKTPRTPRDETIEDSLYKDAEARRLRRELMQRRTKSEEDQERNRQKMNERSARLAQRRLLKELREVIARNAFNGRLTYDAYVSVLRTLGFLRTPAPAPPGSPSRESHTAASEEALATRLWTHLNPDEENQIGEAGVLAFLESALQQHPGAAPPSSPPFGAGREAPLASLERAFAQLYFNKKLAYSGIHHVKSELPSTDVSDECTFRPTIDRKSRQIEELRQSRAGLGSPDHPARRVQRHEMLLEKHRKSKQKLEEERVRRLEEEVAGCTFKPQIYKAARCSPPVSTERSTTFEKLYRHKTHNTHPAAPPTSSIDREIKNHCTFRPQLSTRRGSNRPMTAPAQGRLFPRGFEKSVQRLRQAHDDRAAKKEATESRYTDETYQRRQREAKPFKFMTEQRGHRRPMTLLYMDVNLGGGKTGRIGIREGDDPRELARSFAMTWKLAPQLAARLEEIIRNHIESMTPKRPLLPAIAGPQHPTLAAQDPASYLSSEYAPYAYTHDAAQTPAPAAPPAGMDYAGYAPGHTQPEPQTETQPEAAGHEAAYAASYGQTGYLDTYPQQDPDAPAPEGTCAESAADADAGEPFGDEPLERPDPVPFLQPPPVAAPLEDAPTAEPLVDAEPDARMAAEEDPALPGEEAGAEGAETVLDASAESYEIEEVVEEIVDEDPAAPGEYAPDTTGLDSGEDSYLPSGASLVGVSYDAGDTDAYADAGADNIAYADANQAEAGEQDAPSASEVHAPPAPAPAPLPLPLPLAPLPLAPLPLAPLDAAGPVSAREEVEALANQEGEGESGEIDSLLGDLDDDDLDDLTQEDGLSA